MGVVLVLQHAAPATGTSSQPPGPRGTTSANAKASRTREMPINDTEFRGAFRAGPTVRSKTSKREGLGAT